VGRQKGGATMKAEKCAGCGRPTGTNIWIDDGGAFCKRCAQAKRIKYIQRNELEQGRRGDKHGRINPRGTSAY